MKNSIFARFNELKQMRLPRIAVTVAASFILFLGTACSPSSPVATGSGSYSEGRTTPTELYDTNQPEEGGMNRFDDVDPRRNTSNLPAATKARVDQAERNVNKVNSPKELLDEVKAAAPLREGTKDVTERVGNAVEGLKQDVSEGTQRGFNNLQRNTEQAKQGAKETVDEARQNAAQAGQDAGRNAQRTASDLKGNFSKAGSDIKSNLDETGKDVEQKAQRFADDLS